jgi:hypothetical protein
LQDDAGQRREKTVTTSSKYQLHKEVSMLNVLQILTVIFVTVAFALSLAHALELPGKMRLDKKTYYAVQPIYYPGFTIGGVSEPVGIILTIILLFFTPFGGTGFWLTLTALLGLLAQPVGELQQAALKGKDAGLTDLETWKPVWIPASSSGFLEAHPSVRS